MEDLTNEREMPVDSECQPADEDELREPEDGDPDLDEPEHMVSLPAAGPAPTLSSFSFGVDRSHLTIMLPILTGMTSS